MKERSYWLSSGSYSIFQRLIVIIFGFGSYFLLIRYFPSEKFGVWALFILITSLLEMARSSFIQNAFIKFYKDPEIKQDALFSSSILLNIFSTALFIIVLLISIPFLESFWNTQDIGPMILWYCAASIVLIFFTQLNFLEQANLKFRGVFWGNVTRQGILFTSIAICFFFFPDLPLSFFSFLYFCSTVLGFITSLLLTRKFLPENLFVAPIYLAKLTRFGRYILGTGITSSLGKYFDQFLLGNISLDGVAVYNASVRIINMIEIPVVSIANISYPKLANINHIDSPHELARLYEKTVAGALAIIMPPILIALLFPELLLTITAGEKYTTGADMLRIMAALFFLLPFNVQFGNMCEVVNKPHISFLVNLITNTLSVVLNLFFIKTYGAIGAAYVFAFTLVFIFVIGQIYLGITLNVKLKNVFLEIFRFYRSLFLLLNQKIKK